MILLSYYMNKDNMQGIKDKSAVISCLIAIKITQDREKQQCESPDVLFTFVHTRTHTHERP